MLWSSAGDTSLRGGISQKPAVSQRTGMDDEDEDAAAAPPGPRVPPGDYTLRLQPSPSMVSKWTAPCT